MSEDIINLYYFDVGGKAEVTRLILTLGGIKFNDIRLTKKEFAAKKESGFFKFGQVPIIEINGKQYAQSYAMETWAGIKTKIYPEDETAAFKDDEARQLYNDCRSKLQPSIYQVDPAKKFGLKKYSVKEDFPRILALAEKLLIDNGTEYFSGESFGVADLTWYAGLQWHMSGVIDGVQGFIHNFPKLRNLFFNIHFNPKVREWNEAHSKIRLHYFKVDGRAGGIRMAFHIGGIPFQDIIYQGAEYGAAKQAGKFKFGQVPVLDLDGRQFGQATALENYAATLAGLIPYEPIAKIRCDEARELRNDLLSKLGPSIQCQNPEEKKKLREKYVTEDLPRYLRYLDLVIGNGGTTFLCSNGISIADILWYQIIKAHMKGGMVDGVPENFLDEFKNVSAFLENFRKHDLMNLMDKHLKIF